MEAFQKRIQRSSNAIEIFLAMVLAIALAGLAMGLWVNGVIAFAPETTVVEDYGIYSAEAGRIFLNLDDMRVHRGPHALEPNYRAANGLTCLKQAGGCAALWLACRVFHDIRKAYTPFTQKNVRRFKAIAWLLLASNVVLPLAQGQLYMRLPGKGGGFQAQVDFTGIVCSAILFCLARVFQYGCELQRFSDETL